MDYEKEIRFLAGETLALQRLLVALLSRLAVSDPKHDTIIRAAFDETASFLENRTIAAGRGVPPEHLAHSLRVIEELRAATLGHGDKPKHGI